MLKKAVFGFLVVLLFVIGCTPKFDPARQIVLDDIGAITFECVNTTTGYECNFLNVPDYEMNGVELLELDKKSIEIGNRLAQECEDAGGRFKCYGRCTPLHARVCDFPFEDAGQSCTDSSACQGLCLANDRQCESDCIGTCATYRLNICDNPYELINGVVYFEPVECD